MIINDGQMIFDNVTPLDVKGIETGNWVLINQNLTDETAHNTYSITTDLDGNPFKLEKFLMYQVGPRLDTENTNTDLFLFINKKQAYINVAKCPVTSGTSSTNPYNRWMMYGVKLPFTWIIRTDNTNNLYVGGTYNGGTFISDNCTYDFDGKNDYITSLYISAQTNPNSTAKEFAFKWKLYGVKVL